MPSVHATSLAIRRIGLGTVQFGLDYGVSNTAGKTSKEEAAFIVREAAALGICTLDTAAGYGDSESVLGEVLPHDHKYNIVTKTIQFNKPQIGPEDAKALESAFCDSLRQLHQKRVYALMAHNASDLLADTGRVIWRSMSAFKGDDLVSKIGVSVYTPEQIDSILERYDIDIIQVPLNVFDQRLITSGRLKTLKSRGIEIHARSIFLQGLLLMSPDELPAALAPARKKLRAWREALDGRGISLLAAALHFVLSRSEVNRAVVGVCNVDQLMQIASAIDPRLHMLQLDWSQFALDNEMILNPARWPKER